MIDLHNHSVKSDGTFSPTQLVDYAIEKGLTAFALTDHDSVDGLDEAISYADSLRGEAGAARGIRPEQVPTIIPGIEFSTDYEGQDVHIVGLDFDYHDVNFCQKIQDFLDSRDGRNRKMAEKLREVGIGISYEGMLQLFPDCVLTRAHFARYLFEYGYVRSTREAFERYLGPDCPCYVPREKVTPFQAVKQTLDAGGIPILAHPLIYKFSDKVLNTLVSDLKDAGLLGIEALYCTHSPADERYVRGIASKYDLAISGGSDFHGDNKPGLDMGTGYGKLYIPDDIWPGLLAAREKSKAK